MNKPRLVVTTLAALAMFGAMSVSAVASASPGRDAETVVPQPKPQLESQLLGAAVEDPYEFGTWLGRDLRIWQTWNNYPDWPTMETIPPAHLYFTGEGAAPFDKRWPGRMSMGQPLFAQGETTATCAGGGDDVHYTNIAKALKSVGFGDTVIRLGWEANGDWFWWHATTDNAAEWNSCFQHAYNSFKAVDPRFVIEWNPNKSTDMAGFDSRSNYPGDKYVDVIGVDFYDSWPPYPDEAAWDDHYWDTQNGGSPIGMGAWIAFAQSHRKQLDFPEWGLNQGNDTTNPDNPLFINKMADTFKSLGNYLFEQSYFSLISCNFEIHVNDCNPVASAAYKDRFGD
jgi:hypothetical protein